MLRGPAARHALWVAGLVAIVGTASAETSQEREAREHFEEGLALYDVGRHGEAAIRFERALALSGSPSALFNLARAEQLLGKELVALRHFRRFLKEATLGRVRPPDVERAKASVAELEGKFGHLAVGGPKEMVVRVDGETVEREMDALPGVHRVELISEGRTQVETWNAEAGRTVHVEYRRETVPTVSVSAPGAWPLERVATVAGLGTLGVAGVAGGFLWRQDAIDATDEARRLVQESGGSCLGNASAACARVRTLKDDNATSETSSTIAFVAGGVLLGAAVVAAIYWPWGRRGAATDGARAPRVQMGWKSVAVEGAF